MMQLDLGSKVAITIAGQPEQATTNAVFLIDAVRDAVQNLDPRLLCMLRDVVNKEVLSRSDIITKQTEV